MRAGSATADGGGAMLGFDAAKDDAPAALPAPRDFQPSPTPAPSAMTTSEAAPIRSHALLRGRGADTVIDAYEVFGVCHEGPVGPEDG